MKVAYYKGTSRLALREGAGHLYPGARAELGIELEELSRHLLRCRRHSRAGARLLPPPERAHPRLRRGDGLRHADDDLQRLRSICGRRDAAVQNDDPLQVRGNENLEKVGAPAYSGGVDVKHLLWLIAEVTATTS